MEDILPISAYRRQGRFSPTLFLLAGGAGGVLFALLRYLMEESPRFPALSGKALLTGGGSGLAIGFAIWLIFRVWSWDFIGRSHRAVYRGLYAPPPEGAFFTHRLPATFGDKTFALGRVGGVLYARRGELVFSPQRAHLFGGRGFLPIPLDADTPLRTGAYQPIPWLSPWLGTGPLETLEIGPPGESLRFQVPEAERAARKLREVVLGLTA